MHFNDLGVTWMLKMMQGNYHCDNVTPITKDEAGRGRGARLFLCPLQLGINICIFLFLNFFFNATYGTLQYRYFQTGNHNKNYVIMYPNLPIRIT